MGRREEPVAYIDTHVAVWLGGSFKKRFSSSARDVLNNSELVLSPMAKLELQYLHEIGRLRPDANEVCEELANAIGLRVSSNLFGDIVDYAVSITWTRDPFDRLIVAEAMLAGSPLVTSDQIIRNNYPLAVW